MVTDIEIVINPSIIVDCSITLTIVKNHASLENLDYAHSGHTGFASSEDVSNLAAQVPALQTTATVVLNALTNINGRTLTNYGATLTPADHSYVQYTYYTITYRGSTPTEEQARNYMEYMTGSRYLPSFDYEKPKNSLFIFADGSLWKPQYSEGELRLYQIPNPFALRDDLFSGNILKSSIIPDEFQNVMEFQKQVSGSSFMTETLATDLGSIVWCAATKAICGDAYYRKFLVNNDGTQAGVTTIDPQFGKLYVGKTDNNIFKWSGSNLLEVSKSLGLGETSTTAYAGNKGKANAQAIAQLQTDVAGKQDELVSGTNIKTINGVNVLGSGDVTVPGQPLTKIFKYATNVAFTQEEITMLKSLQAYVQLSYGGGSSAGQRNYFPVSNNRYGYNELILGSITGSGGFYVMTINTTDGTWSETYTRISSAIYRHEITVPAQTWYYQNSSTTYITKIIFFSKVQTAITNTDELFNFFRDNDINDGKVCFSDGTHNGCMGLHFYINPAGGYRKIANLVGTNSNYWYNAPSTAYSLTDTVTVY